MRQLRAAGIDAPIVTGESLDGDYWIGSDTGSQRFLRHQLRLEIRRRSGPRSQRLLQALRSQVRQEGRRVLRVRGYSAVQAWAAAANKAGSLEGSKVAAVLDTFDKKPLVIGPTT